MVLFRYCILHTGIYSKYQDVISIKNGMKKIRIAIFTGNYNHIRDGVSLTLNRLTAFLLEKGHEVLIFGPTIATPALEHAGELVSVPSAKIPGRPEYRMSLSLPAKQRRRLEKFKP